MNRRVLLPAVCLADRIAGDPEGFPHPVRLMGIAIDRGETALRRPHQSGAEELIAGAALTVVLVRASYSLTRVIIRQAYRRSKVLGSLSEIVLGWTCFAARNLEQEATFVIKALDSGDVVLARRRLARIVGRDTQHLDFHEISRAVIETLAESASDGILAPLFYMSLGGVPLAMAYKAANTLDSMIGHADVRYFYFGKAAARLDECLNAHWFRTLNGVRSILASWRHEYNCERPHSSLDYRTPDEFRKKEGYADMESTERFPHPHSLGGCEIISELNQNRETLVING